MIRAELTSHPLTPSHAVRSIVATVRRNASFIDVSFVVSGEIAQIALPAPEEASPADELWQHTCFELFARAPGSKAYTEFNFSPSTRWAAYEFSAYREGMTRKTLSGAPTVHLSTSDDRLEFHVKFEARDLPAPIAELAVTAVIEESSGVKSYWALNHRIDKPDFHHEHGFVLILN